MDTVIIDYALKVIAVASVLHIFLPPYETFGKFPKFQVYYQVVVETIGYIALNARGKFIQQYPSFQSGKQPIDRPPAP